MPWDTAEIEGRAEEFRKAHGAQPRESIVTLARRALGPSSVSTAMHSGVVVNDAALVWEYGSPKILVRPKLGAQPWRIAWGVAHELGELILGRAGYRESNVEQVANGLAAALLMPRAEFSAAYAAHGFDLATLAGEFCAPQGAAALRIGEVTDEPVGLVTASRVHRRDALERLPDDEMLYQLSRVPRVPRPLARHILTDVRRVVAFHLAA